MRHVETLTVSRTNLAIVAVNDFDLFPNLRTLNLHQNKLARIAKNSFRVLNQLTSLDLSNNNIMHLSRDHLVGLQACQTLNLSRNYLGSVIADQVWPVMQLFCLLFTVKGNCNKNSIFTNTQSTFVSAVADGVLRPRSIVWHIRHLVSM